MARIVSIDYGLARLGIALSDESQFIASLDKVLPAEKTIPLTIKALLLFLAPYKVEKIVVGLPIHMDGKMSPLANAVLEFVALLQKEVPYPVITWDERLTTAQAEKLLVGQGMNRKKRSHVVDAVAASLILQSYLDSPRCASLPSSSY